MAKKKTEEAPVEGAEASKAEAKEERKWFHKEDGSIDESAKHPDHGFSYSQCHDKFVTVTLQKPIWLNGQKYGPGEVTLPEESYHLYSLAL